MPLWDELHAGEIADAREPGCPHCSRPVSLTCAECGGPLCIPCFLQFAYKETTICFLCEDRRIRRALGLPPPVERDG